MNIEKITKNNLKSKIDLHYLFKSVYLLRFTSEDFMKKTFSRFGFHLAVFILIEVIFVLLLFRELPETNLITLIGILHTSYWIILLFAGRVREKSHFVRQKACCTYVPVLYHLLIHLYAGWAALEIHHETTGIHHNEHEIGWMIAGASLLGVLIFVGEYLLHRKLHCDTHHEKAHKNCHDNNCEQKHV